MVLALSGPVRARGGGCLSQKNMAEVVREDVVTEAPLRADVYHCPSTAASASDVSDASRPVIMFLHGGGWHLGRKEVFGTAAPHLARDGYVVVSCEYHRSPFTALDIRPAVVIVSAVLVGLMLTSAHAGEFAVLGALWLVTVIMLMWLWLAYETSESRHPQQAEAVARQVRWVRQNIARYGGNPDRITLMGHSAGAHLALLIGTNEAYLLRVGESLRSLHRCVGLSGVYSDKRLAQTWHGRLLLHTAFGTGPTHYDAFPIYHTSERTPPTLLINAEDDNQLEHHTTDLYYALKQEGVTVATHIEPRCEHMNIYHEWGPGQARRELWERIRRFIESPQ